MRITGAWARVSGMGFVGLVVAAAAVGGLREGDPLVEAEALLRQVVEGREKALGKEHPRTIEARAHLARACARQGKRDEAIRLMREVVALSAEVFGAHHARTLDAMEALALLLLDGETASTSAAEAERARETTAVVSQMLQQLLESPTPPRPDRDVTVKQLLDSAVEQASRIGDPLAEAQIRHRVGLALEEAGELESAEETLRRAARIRAGLLGDEHPLTLESREAAERVKARSGKDRGRRSIR